MSAVQTPFDRAREVDSLVIGLVEKALGGPAPGGGNQGWALVALGGYGRRRLAPFSDIDLAVVHANLPAETVNKLVQAVFYPLWDAGVKLSHTVRTVKEAAAFGRTDIHWLTSSLDARFLTGDDILFQELSETMLKVAKRKSAKPFIDELIKLAGERGRRFGDAGRLREPEIKEGRGGLRDIQTVRWAARALGSDRAGGEPLDALTAMGLISSADRADILEAEDFLWELRRALHTEAGRDLNRVQTEFQPALAEHFFPGDDQARVRFSSRLYQALRATAEITGNFLDRARAKAPPAVSAALTPPVLLDALSRGLDGLPALERLARTGALEALLPEWAGINGLSFSDPNHRHPVDTHSFLTVGELAAFRAGDRFLAAQLSEEIAHPDWLLWAGLFHDIGKGRDDPHSEAGADLIPEISRRLGLDRHAGETIGFLVRHHLLLSHVAARRDLNDPRVIDGVAAVVGDGDRLRMLYLLTLADALATGPKAWNSWKSALVDELFLKALEVLEGPSERSRSSQVRLSEKHFELLEQDEEVFAVLWREAQGPDELAVVAPDRPGLISRIAGVLALNRINVLAAGFYTTDDGRALEVFKVAAAFETEITDEMYGRVEKDIAKSLSGQMALSYHLDELARRYRRRTANGARVVFDNKASDRYTVIEVHAPDELGVLYEVTGALAELNLDIHFAKVSTFGDRAVDAFYVSNLEGGKVTEPDYLKEIEKNVLFRLSKT